MKYGSDKEVQAVTLKLKEQRLLEKADAALELERAYSLKLLELGSREVKLHQRRLKSKVGKIKSYLTAEEIKEFRNLEMQGKFKPLVNSVQVSGAFTIAAAAKRLKLQRAQKTSAYDSMDGPPRSRSVSRQGASVTRSSLSAPPTGRSRTSSTGTHFPPSGPRTSFGDSDSVFDDLSTIPETPRAKTPRMMTPGRRRRPATSLGIIRENTSRPSRSKSSLGYSSHDATEKENRDRERCHSAVTAARISSRRASLISDSSLDGDLAKERRHEIRQMLLEEELINAEDIQERQQDFLDKVNKWNREGMARQYDMEKVFKVLAQDTVGHNNFNSQFSDSKSSQKTSKKSARKSNSFHGRVEFRRREDGPPLEANWKDLTKCRYLRVSNDQIDLSGVVTLAKDQMRLFQPFKKAEYDEFDDCS